MHNKHEIFLPAEASSCSGAAPCVPRRINPFIERGYDGISVSPLEQMFVKVKAEWVEREMSGSSLAAVTYSQWKLGKVGRGGDGRKGGAAGTGKATAAGAKASERVQRRRGQQGVQGGQCCAG